MTDALVLVPCGFEFLALTRAGLAAAREKAREVLPGWGADPGAGATTQNAEKLHTALEMEGAWFLEAARAGTVPHYYRIGRYVRFDLAEVRDCTRFRSRPGQRAARGAP